MNITQNFMLSNYDEMINQSFRPVGGWDTTNQLQNNIIFSISIIGIIFHFQLWCQLFIHKTKFDLSFLFPFAYISSDVFLLLSYIIQYSIRTRSWISITPLFCYFEAYSMFYFNLFELYCLTALNICRYCQIVRNQNIYILHRRKLILIFIIIQLLLLINLILQHVFGWCIITENFGSSCVLTYTNLIIHLWNIIIILIMPILISFLMLYRAVYFLRITHAQQGIIRRNHHHRLIIHSSIFYSIWLTLWSPLMFISFLNINTINQWIVFVIATASTLETVADTIITVFLDQRIAHVWKKSWTWIKNKTDRSIHIRVNPTN